MLLYLHVKNLALIDDIEIDFTNNLNILTGETGAGKSILIDSINIALGSKIPKDMLRDDSSYGLVELIFKISDEEVINQLKEQDLTLDDNEILISRKISSGRSICKINGETVTAGTLAEVGKLMIDIHGQHAHQSLLYKSNHLKILDDYANQPLEKLKLSLASCYDEYQLLIKKIQASTIDEEKRLREIAFTSFEIEEIESAFLKNGEDEILSEQYKVLSNAVEITDVLSEIYQVTGDIANEGIGKSSLGKSLKRLKHIESLDTRLVSFRTQLEDIDNLINDIRRDIKSYTEDTTFEATDFARIEGRLNLINSLKAKYGKDIETILAYKEEQQEKLLQLTEYEAYIHKLGEEKTLLEKKIQGSCDKISRIRLEHAVTFGEKIKDALKDLNFLAVNFLVSVKPLNHFTRLGQDDIEFLISTNPGETMKPLGKVASGGELSRIMLGIKSVMADMDAIETLIFDEIDVGISGRTAQMVSEKLALIAKNHQVICITHLPQIAAMADSHYLIEKITSNNKTNTFIKKLTDDEIIIELARILGGVMITDAVLNNAKEMKLLANSKK